MEHCHGEGLNVCASSVDRSYLEHRRAAQRKAYSVLSLVPRSQKTKDTKRTEEGGAKTLRETRGLATVSSHDRALP